jgi:hypothetical protein
MVHTRDSKPYLRTLHGSQAYRNEKTSRCSPIRDRAALPHSDFSANPQRIPPFVFEKPVSACLYYTCLSPEILTEFCNTASPRYRGGACDPYQVLLSKSGSPPNLQIYSRGKSGRTSDLFRMHGLAFNKNGNSEPSSPAEIVLARIDIERKTNHMLWQRHEANSILGSEHTLVSARQSQ